MRFGFLVMVCAALASHCPAAAQPASGPAASSTNPPLREISTGVFQLGDIRLDKPTRSLQFPAQLNMREGLIEYLLVNAKGKSYESLLRTEVEPYEVHLAMLLIGAKGAPQTPALLAAPSVPFHVNQPPGQTNAAAPLAAVAAGDRIRIELSWNIAGKGEQHARAEDWVFNLATKTNAARGPWIYNGSRVVKGVFLAQREGSIVAMIDDIDALVNNPRPGHDNDQIWSANTNVLPPLNTPVEVTFRLANPTQ